MKKRIKSGIGMLCLAGIIAAAFIITINSINDVGSANEEVGEGYISYSYDMWSTGKYEYLLRYKDLSGHTKCLLLNPIEGDSILLSDEFPAYTRLIVNEGSVLISDGMCWIDVDGCWVVTSDFCLQRYN